MSALHSRLPSMHTNKQTHTCKHAHACTYTHTLAKRNGGKVEVLLRVLALQP